MTRFSFRHFAGGLLLLLMCAAVWSSMTRLAAPPHRPVVLSEKTIRVSEQRCAECHFEITESFQSMPHSLTLSRAADPEILNRFAGRTFHRPEADVAYHFKRTEDRLSVESPAYAREMPIEWVFGSGTHAQTPLLLWTDNRGNTSGIEHIVSWYPDGELGVTLGQEKLTDSFGIHAMGHHLGPAEVINCFGCHSTHVPTDGQRIRFEEIHPGVGCARCHAETEAHVRQMDRGDDATIERLSRLSPLESIDRCGECHRRASEMGGPVTADNQTILRFAPVGLSQSPCFLKQDQVILDSGETARLDCTTCHDPHRLTSRDWKVHVRACLDCHDSEKNRAVDCSRETRESNCLTCHMPKISVNEHLQFTDHWIRVRRESTENDAR